MQPRCFVIQPFDEGGPYDKRYDETFEPAIEAAGLEAYRVDKDPGVDVLIEDIEQKIAESDACLADVSTDNPNVWFELGYAMAKDRVVVLICSDEREDDYPFDVRHRKIIKYSTKSESGYRKLKRAITRHLEERRSKMQQAERQADAITAPQPAGDRLAGRQHDVGVAAGLTEVAAVQQSTDLREYEIRALAIVAGVPDQTLPDSTFHELMMKSGFQGHAASVASQSLLDKGLLEEERSDNWHRMLYVTQEGMRVLSKLMDGGELPVHAENPRSGTSWKPDPEDDLPF